MRSEEELDGASSLRWHTLADAGEVGPADGGRRRSSERAGTLLAALLCFLFWLLPLLVAHCCRCLLLCFLSYPSVAICTEIIVVYVVLYRIAIRNIFVEQPLK